MPEPDEEDRTIDYGTTTTPSAKHGFFSIYKKGQGYWTRMGTALGAAILIAVAAIFFYPQLKTGLPSLYYTPIVIPTDASPEDRLKLETQNKANSLAADKKANRVAAGVTGGVILGGVIVSWVLMNKPRNVDFLIATDAEMKKVNWTSRKELMGSTRVVIFFMFLIALSLFFIDVFAGIFFQLIGLLKFGPLS